MKKERIYDAGITLIALVVTIIVLLILAGITIGMAVNDNGIFKKANKAVDIWNNAKDKENSAMNNYSDTLQNAYDNLEGGPVLVTIKIDGTVITSENAPSFYGRAVSKESYKPTNDSAGTYRVFYYDAEGEFGPEGTLYLKRDYDGNNNFDGRILSSKNYAGSDDAVAEMRRMNKMWKDANPNLTKYVDLTNPNSKDVAYLCDKTQWTQYADEKISNCYAIGSPSIEMYYKSYMAVEHKKSGKTNWTINYPTDDNSGKGYSHNAGAMDSLDYIGYDSMYCGKNGKKGDYYWCLASPSSDDRTSIFCVGGDYACFGKNNDYDYYGTCPLVSIKSEVNLITE